MGASQENDRTGTHEDQEERAGKALRDAEVISSEELKKAVDEHERTGKPLKSILFGQLTLDRLRRVLQTEISLGKAGVTKKKPLADMLVDAEWITKEQLAEAERHAEESGHPLGRILVAQGAISLDELESALKVQSETGHTLGRTLMNLGYVMPKQVSDALWAQRTIPFLSLKRDDEEIGKMLVERNLLAKDRWKAAWEDYVASKERFVDFMLAHDLATDEQLAQVMAAYHKLPYVDLTETSIKPEAVSQLPAALIHENQVIPFDLTDSEIHIASYEPKRVSAFDTIGAMTGRRVKRFVAPRGQVLEAIKKHVEAPEPMAVSAPAGEQVEIKRDEMTSAFTEEGEKLLAQLSTSSTTELVQKIIEGAINARATDIHFDPQENVLRIRYRVDGMLHDVMNLPIAQAPHVISRIKVMANMDIVDRLHPQDGHINTLVQGRYQDMRVASVPASLGEKLTIRLMDPSNVLTGLNQLGFEEYQLEMMHKLVSKPYGLMLATGPVGSGKTTTLYSCLNQVNVLEKNVMSIEDPVEYRLRGTNQIQVDYKRNLGFAEGLRAMLRQDPNVIMVGEIRDNDTARTAVRASLTGVLVMSTMHANDAPGTVSTLFNHGIPGFLVANSLTGVVAQRLIRKICPDCREEYKPDKEMLRQTRVRGVEDQEFTFARGNGCPRCFHTGYLGRTGVYEIMEVDEEIKDLIFRQTTREVIRQVAIDMGMQTLMKSTFNKVAQGITTVEEYFRVVFI